MKFDSEEGGDIDVVDEDEDIKVLKPLNKLKASQFTDKIASFSWYFNETILIVQTASNKVLMFDPLLNIVNVSQESR